MSRAEDPRRKYRFEIVVMDDGRPTFYFSNALTIEGSYVRFDPLFKSDVSSEGEQKNLEMIFPSEKVSSITHRKLNPQS